MNNTLAEIATQLFSKNNFTLVGHMIPDGDCIGSVLAMYRALSLKGKQVNAYLPEGIPETYMFLLENSDINLCISREDFYENVIFLDCANKSRAGHGITEMLTPGTTIFNIDHHDSNDFFGTYNLVDPHAAATGEILTWLFSEQAFIIDKPIVNALYVAIVMDTGNFKYANTTSNTLETAAYLLRNGVDLNLIRIKLFESKTLDEMTILKMALNTLQISEDYKIAWMQLSYADITAQDLNNLHPEGIINFAKNIKDVEIAVLFREIEPGLIKIGFRSKFDLDVSKLAEHFDGGGHKQAAGARQRGTLEEVSRNVISYIKGVLI